MPTDRTFWFGDAAGSLFRVHLRSVTVGNLGGGQVAAFEGTVTNLLRGAASWHPDAVLRMGTTSTSLSGGTTTRVRGGASAPFALASRRIPSSAAVGRATLIFGPAGTNQSIVALASGGATRSEAPVEHVVPTAAIRLVPGATAQVERSVLYPRYGDGRVGQRRLVVYLAVTATFPDPNHLVLLHPSLITPDGSSQSVGDRVVAPPGAHLTEFAVINPPIAGRYRLAFLEMTDQVKSGIDFEVR